MGSRYSLIFHLFISLLKHKVFREAIRIMSDSLILGSYLYSVLFCPKSSKLPDASNKDEQINRDEGV